MLVSASASSCTTRAAHTRWRRPARPGQSAVAARKGDASSVGTPVEGKVCEEDYIEIGRIMRAHGVRGEVSVRPLTSQPEEQLETPGRRCAAQLLIIVEIANTLHFFPLSLPCGKR
jgi:RimM N-terminal domain